MPLLRKIILVPLFILIFISFLIPAGSFAEHDYQDQGGPWQYRLGKGLRIADSHFFLGGYINIEYSDEAGEKEYFEFDDLSFFLFGDIGEKFRFFSELENDGFYEMDTSGNSESEENWIIERVYADYLYSDSLHLRGGKFLTPVGIWNEVHAAPLTWTVSRPPVTEATFPEFATGGQFYGNLSLADEDLAYNLFAQSGESINEWTGFRKTHSMIGGKITWFGSPSFKASLPLLYYEEYEIEDKVYLTGFDLTYKKPGYEISLESTYSRVDLKAGGKEDEYGYYIMGVYGLTENLFAVLRHDWLKVRESEDHHEAVNLGLTYKYRPQVVFKVEGQLRHGDLVIADELNLNDNERLLLSFSLLL